MTREEAIAILDGFKHNPLFNQQHFEALDMAISALSAEPCREADDYENEIADLHNRLDIAEYDKERYKEEITTLEVENKGKWIWNKPTNPISYCKCSACNSGCWEMEFNYCPNCGARMGR